MMNKERRFYTMTFKRLLTAGFAFMLSLFIAGCNTRAHTSGQSSPPSASRNQTDAKQAQGGNAGNVLIAYFTTSGVVDRSLIDPSIDAASQASIVIPNLEIVAGYINETIGGTIKKCVAFCAAKMCRSEPWEGA
jgi:hypothetical protein